VVSLKVFFPEFYKEKRFYLYLAMIILTFPVTLRAVLDFVTYNNENFSAKINDDNGNLITYQWVFFVFTQVTPILAQMGSFVFGFMRHSQLQQKKKESQEEDKPDEATVDSSINLLADDKDGSSSSEDNAFSYQELSSRYFDPPIEFYTG